MSLAAFALVASPLLAFLGVLLGHRVRRRNALALDRWHKREEKRQPPRARSRRASGASRPHATPELPHP